MRSHRPPSAPRRLLVALAAACILAAGVRGVQAGPVDDAVAHADAGRAPEAVATLRAWLDAGAVSAAELLRAAELARTLQDLDLLGGLQRAGEGLQEKAEAPHPVLDLALGFTYLGLAEENLRRRTGSRSISLYFADALTRAGKVPREGPHASDALRLAAATRYAKGDLDGAIEGLRAGLDEIEGDGDARLRLLHGRLRYERGVARGTKADGHPADDARPELQAAAELLGAVLDDASLRPAQRRDAQLRVAWSHHRLGAIDEAVAAYRAAYAGGTRAGTLAVRGLQSVLARDGERLVRELAALVAEHPGDELPANALVQAQVAARDLGAALLAAHARLEQAPDDPDALHQVGRVLLLARKPAGARRYFVAALRREANHLGASGGLEAIARLDLTERPARALEVYEELLALRPDDPYVRNNFGFVLRDLVSRHTRKERSGLERIAPGAPATVRAWLERCVEVYAEAVARIDPAQDGERETYLAWNLAGIVNDYALILHYFVDVQDAELAERMYHRALRMSDHGFKDTYVPNLHRLYRHVLRDRPWAWYRAAREARDAILREAQDEQGRLVLLPDEPKREIARRDVLEARARILQELEMDAEEDGLPWPPRKENGNDR